MGEAPGLAARIEILDVVMTGLLVFRLVAYVFLLSSKYMKGEGKQPPLAPQKRTTVAAKASTLLPPPHCAAALAHRPTAGVPHAQFLRH